MTMINRILFTVMILALILPSTGFASEEEALAELAMRPLGFASFVVGSAIFVVTLPVSIVVGGTDDMAEVLVKRPYRFTFQRDMAQGLEYSEPNPDW
jgi:hypothetical protein